MLCVLQKRFFNLHLDCTVYGWFHLLGESSLRGQLWMDGALNFTMEGIEGIATNHVGSIRRLYIHEVPPQAPYRRFSLPSHDFQLSTDILHRMITCLTTIVYVFYILSVSMQVTIEGLACPCVLIRRNSSSEKKKVDLSPIFLKSI